MNLPEARHPMKVVTLRTGLRADLIRAWERRHQAIAPSRTEGNRRLYTDADIERLLLIRRALDAGWQIGHVAALSDEEILALLANAPPVATLPAARREPDQAERHVQRCLELVADLDEEGLRDQLEQAAVDLGGTGLIERCLVPLIVAIGEGYGDGTLRPAQEHLATSILRSYLDSMHGAFRTAATTPSIVVTTPRFQHHELGAMLVAATARGEGWRTTYLGPNLPPEEIAAAAIHRKARALALSITFPADDPDLPAELVRLRRMLPAQVDILVGGRSAGAYREALDTIRAVHLRELADLRAYLAAATSTRATR